MTWSTERGKPERITVSGCVQIDVVTFTSEVEMESHEFNRVNFRLKIGTWYHLEQPNGITLSLYRRDGEFPFTLSS